MAHTNIKSWQLAKSLLLATQYTSSCGSYTEKNQQKIGRFPFIRTLSQMRICVPIQSHHQQIKIETQFVAGLFTVSLQLLWRFPLPILVFVSFFQCILTIWRLYNHNNHSVCQDCVLEQLVLSAFWFFWFIHCIFF